MCSLFLRFGRCLFVRCLLGDGNARIHMPPVAEVALYQEVFSRKYSMLRDVYCVADGFKLYLEQAQDFLIQNMFYNGWIHDHYVGNVFVLAPSGALIARAINIPGAMHDSQRAEWGAVYEN